MSLHVIILAAGNGKRMFSQQLKVLHPIGGKPMVARVIEAAQQLQPEMIHLVHGHQSEQLKQALPEETLHWIMQDQQLGTGHAVLQALPFIPEDATILVLYGDVPLIQARTLEKLVQATNDGGVALLLAYLANPHGLGRIIRNEQGQIQRIVEEKDATPAEKQINEIYSGICALSAKNLKHWLPQLSNTNAQNEYYLTDIVGLAVQEKQAITSVHTEALYEIQGINNRLQWQQLERIWQQQYAESLLLSGVAIADAARIDIRGELSCGYDVFIDVNCVFIGEVFIGDGSRIGPNCVISNSRIGQGCEIFANSNIDNAQIADHCAIGPFARLRPNTVLGDHCKIGNFVETKNTVFGEACKASHLSYIGDAQLGEKVNIGAGVITCNYDGVNKHQTIIEDGVFIGSDSQLVAPIKIGAYATIGAGSTLRKDVPAQELTLSESKQKTIYGWKRPTKK